MQIIRGVFSTIFTDEGQSIYRNLLAKKIIKPEKMRKKTIFAKLCNFFST